MAFHSGQNEMTIPFRPKWKDHSGQNEMVAFHSIPARMKWTIPFRPEWNGPFHSSRNEMDHSILARMENTRRNIIPATFMFIFLVLFRFLCVVVWYLHWLQKYPIPLCLDFLCFLRVFLRLPSFRSSSFFFSLLCLLLLTHFRDTQEADFLCALKFWQGMCKNKQFFFTYSF